MPNQEVERATRETIEKEMSGKGYKKVDGQADCHVAIHAKKDEWFDGGLFKIEVLDGETGKVVAAVSTLSKDIQKGLKHTGNVEAAQSVGKAIAEKAKSAGIEIVAFDRSGFKYHGRVKALADAAREAGLKFFSEFLAHFLLYSGLNLSRSGFKTSDCA